MDEQIASYGNWYYCSYLLLRIICWFALGFLFASVLQLMTGKEVINSISLGTCFSIAGGFFRGIFHILIEE